MSLFRTRRPGLHDDGFTLIETLVALVVFSASILLFERAVAVAWRAITSANARTGAVTLGYRKLEEAGTAIPLAVEGDSEGQSGRYGWRRHIQAAASEPTAQVTGGPNFAPYWVTVDVWWRDGTGLAPKNVRFRMLKLGVRPT